MLNEKIHPVSMNVVNPCGSDEYPYGNYLTLLEGVRTVDRMIDEGMDVDHMCADGTLFGTIELSDSDREAYEEEDPHVWDRLNCWQTLVVNFPSKFAKRLAVRWNCKVVSR